MKKNFFWILILITLKINAQKKELEDYLLAYNQYLQRNYEQAAKLLNYNNIYLSLFKSKILIESHQPLDAIKELKNYENLPTINFEIAKIFAQIRSVDSTIFYIKKAKEKHFEILKSDLILKWPFSELYNYEKWLNFLDTVKFDYPTRLDDAQINLLNKNYYETIIICNEILQKHKNNLKALEIKAEALFLLQNYDDALKVYENILKLQPQNYEIYNKLAQIYMKTGNFKKAYFSLEKSLNINEFQANNIYLLSFCQYQLKQYEKALQTIKIYNNYIFSKETIYLEAQIYIETGEYLEALKTINKIQSPVSEEYFFIKGLIFYKLKNFNEAFYHFSQSLDLNYQNVQAKYYKANCLWSLGYKNEACQIWQQISSDEIFAKKQFLENCQKNLKIK